MDEQYIRYLNGFKSLFVPKFKILAYHGVNRFSRDPYEVSADEFERQIQYLVDRGVQVLSLKDAVSNLLNASINNNSIVITFDDGFKSLKEYAFPVLREYKLPATVFLPITYVGKYDGFSYKYDRKEMQLLDWRDIEESTDFNISYGSHSMSHKNLVELNDRDLLFELQKSREMLSLKVTDRFIPFAYPFGMFDSRVKRAVETAGYHCALCFGNVMSNTRYTSLFELKREKILANLSHEKFKRKVDVRKDLMRKLRGDN